MTASRNPILAQGPQRSDDRRRHGRIRIEDVTCALGDVVDLSASGMRVRGKPRRGVSVGEQLAVTLSHGQFTLPVQVRIVHVERVAFRRYVLGAAFESIRTETRDQLAHLATVAAARRTLT